MKLIIKCQCREIDITKHEHVHRDAEAGMFCGRCRTTFTLIKKV